MTSVDLRDVRALAVRHPLAAAFAISLVLHVCFFGFWQLGKQLGWWQHQATWLLNWHKKKMAKPPRPFLKIPDIASARQPEVRLTFVEVDPSTPAVEPPKDTKFYGAKSARAANPDETLNTDIPKIDGTQNKIMRTEDVPKPNKFPLQPAIEPAKDDRQEEPKPPDTPGDMAKTKPITDGINLGRGEEQKVQRPRTLQEAHARNQLAGQKAKVDGAAKVRGRVSLNVRETPFGSYDAAFIAAVQQRWYDLLDSSQFSQRSGKVVLEFKLTYDGRIVDLKTSDNEVGEILSLLCQRAILDPAPYARWPDDMRRMIGSNHREVTFTFYYN